MTLQERLDRLEPRERRLLGVLVAVFAVFVVVLVPAGLMTLLGAKQAESEALREAIEAIQDGRERVRKRDADRAALQQRYARPAPPLAGFLEGLAKRNDITIQENQDRALVKHGKQYEERATKIVISQAGLYNLIKFFEAIEQSGHPARISKLHIRKRGVANDSYDVQMVVSAFDAKLPEEKPAGEGAEPGASARDDGDESASSGAAAEGDEEEGD